MPAQSKQQQKFMGIVHAIQKGELDPKDASPKAKQVAKDMKPSDVTDFASTPHKGLPKKVKQEILNRLKEYAGKMGKDHMGGDDIPSQNKGGLRDNDGYDNVDYNRDMKQHEGIMSTLDQIRQASKNSNDFIKKVLSDNDFKDMKTDRDFIKYLKSIYEGIDENFPTNWLQGRVSDYHTKKGTTPREKYDKTNFNPDNSGQEDLKDEELKEAGEDINNVPIPADVKIKLQKALDILHGKKLTYPQKLQVLGRVLDSLGIDKKELNKVTQKIKTKLETVTEDAPCWNGYKQVGMKTKGGKQVPNCVKESVNEAADITSLKKIHDAVFKFLKTKKGVGEVKEFSEFPNRYGDNVSTFSVKYNIEDKYNYDLQEIKIEYSTSRVFIPNKGYFPFKTFNDIKNIINKKSSLKESVNEAPFHALNNPRMKKSLSNLVKDKKVQNPETGREVSLQTAVSNSEHPAHDRAVSIKKSLLQRLKGMMKNEYGSVSTDTYLKPTHDDKVDGTPEDKDAINTTLDETMIRRAVDIAQELLPKDTWSRFSSDGKKNAEFVKNVVRDLTQSLNRFYKNHKIDIKIQEEQRDSNVDMVLGVLSILRQIEDKENRKQVGLDMIRKFKEQNIEFDYQEFLDLMKK